MTAADDVVEDKAGDRPGDVVGRRRWRDETGAAEDDGEVDVADEAALPLELDEVLDKRAQEANEDHEKNLKGQGDSANDNDGYGRGQGQDLSVG